MNHQVEHDIDIGRARIERRQPVRLDKCRRLQLISQVQQRRIETFEMTDLDNQIIGQRQFDQIIGFINGDRDRFLDQHVAAMFEEVARDLMVQRGRCSDTNRVDLAQQLVVVRQCLDAMLVGNRLCGLGIGIDHRNEFAVVQRRVFVRVKFSQVTDADNGCFKLAHVCSFFL